MNNRLYLKFVEYHLDTYVAACEDLFNQGAKRILLRPYNSFASEIINRIPLQAGLTFYAKKDECEANLPKNIELLENSASIDAVVFCTPEAEILSSRLMEYLDLEHGFIIAPITQHYYRNKSLFLISIPKSGTHLLYRLAEIFGYKAGIILNDQPTPGNWYCLEYSNSHTSAKDFFIDTVRRSPLGNRHHPFPATPAIFIYRNPLDILVSEANYYHKEGKTLFHGYLSNRSFEQRLLTLLDDPWLLGSIRDRIGSFLPWLEFQNVIPISFEELVGASGGASELTQIELIWSLQLKLHIPGDPKYFGKLVFDKDSPTFYEGRIGSFRQYFNKDAYKSFYNLPQDFMRCLGYDFDFQKEKQFIPKRAKEFRYRPVVYSQATFENLPILVERNFLDHSIVKYNSLYYGIPKFFGDFRLEYRPRLTLKLLASDLDITKLKQKIMTRFKWPTIFRKVFWFLYFGIENSQKKIFKK